MTNLLAEVSCLIFGGHDFRLFGRVLVCEFCGKRVRTN